MKYFMILMAAMMAITACDDASERTPDLYVESANYCRSYQQCEWDKFNYHFNGLADCSNELGMQTQQYVNTSNNVKKCSLAVESYYQCVNSMTCGEWQELRNAINNKEYHQCFFLDQEVQRVCNESR